MRSELFTDARDFLNSQIIRLWELRTNHLLHAMGKVPELRKRMCLIPLNRDISLNALLGFDISHVV